MASRRVHYDVKRAATSTSLSSHGIYYIPCEENILKGTALLVGREGTPYFGGFYFFSIEFPAEYPFVPPKVLSLTQDGRTRFNPNMYIDGKVCLSILNTWHDGPQWSGVLTIESVLLSIMSDVLNHNPLENEPMYTGCGMTLEAQTYNRIISHANLQTAILEHLTNPPSWARSFKEIMTSEFLKMKPALLKLCAEASVHDGKTETIRVFSMACTYDFAGFHTRLVSA